MEKLNAIAAMIRAHGCKAQIVGGVLMVFNSLSDASWGHAECGKWIVLPASFRAARLWLGY